MSDDSTQSGWWSWLRGLRPSGWPRRFWRWLRPSRWLLPIVVAVVAALISVGGAYLIAEDQLGESRAAADERARHELLLAAVVNVLDAPTCEAAEARAILAKAVLGPALPADFVDSVRRAARASAFDTFNDAFLPSRYLDLFRNVADPELQERLRAKLEEERKRAMRERDRLCSQLGG